MECVCDNGNDHDGGASYVHSDGQVLTLTPFLLKQWARAIYAGEATLFVPPSTEHFDLKNKRMSVCAPSVAKASIDVNSAPAISGSSDVHPHTVGGAYPQSCCDGKQ